MTVGSLSGGTFAPLVGGRPLIAGLPVSSRTLFLGLPGAADGCSFSFRGRPLFLSGFAFFAASASTNHREKH